MRPRILASALLSTLLATWAIAAPGDLDSTFGTNGSVYLRIGPSVDSIREVLLQPDGKVIAVGLSSSGGLSMARYLPSGALDPAFGSAGKIIHSDFNFVAKALLQPDGRIVVAAGRSDPIYSAPVPHVARFMPDGSVDTSFTSLPGHGSAIALQPDGKIVYSRSTSQSPGSMRAFRLMADGTPDVAFNDVTASQESQPGYVSNVLIQPDGAIVLTGHIDTTPFSGGFIARRMSSAGVIDPAFNTLPDPGGQAFTSVLQPDGKIVVGGCNSLSEPGLRRPVLARFLPTGAADPAFDADGYMAVAPGSSERCARALALRPDGRIVIAASNPNFESQGFHAIQTMPDGSLDASFGTAGSATLFASTRSGAYDVALQPDGKLILAGDEWQRDYALARLEANGTLDPGFGAGGLVVTGFLGGRAPGLLALRRSQDRFFVLGSLLGYSVFGEPVVGDMALARLLGDGSMDPTFGTEGQFIGSLSTSLPGNDSYLGPAALAVQPDGKPVVVGYGLIGGASVAAAMRLNVDGTLDTAFGNGGRRAIASAGPGLGAKAVEVMPDGRIVVAGLTRDQVCTSPCPYDAFVARLLPDGSFDPSFGAGGIFRREVDGSSGAEAMTVRILIQPDASVVVRGVRASGLATLRLTAQGQLDPSFGSGGISDPGLPANLAAATAAAIVRHADGDLVVVGSGNSSTVLCFPYAGTPSYAVFAWMNSSGGIDASLPPERRLAGGLRSFVALGSAFLDAQERVVAGGTRHNRCISGEFTGITVSERRPIVARFTPSGALDLAFGNAGWAELPATTLQMSVWTADVARLDDGRIMVLTSDQGLHRIQGGGGSTPIGSVADLDDDGIPNGVETAESRDPFVRDNDVFASGRLFVMQQYRDFLGREGDANGITSWTNFMTGGENRATVADSFLRSAEFEGTVAPMTRLYFAYFLRIPDYGGLSFWIGQFRAGNSLEAISNQFAASPEFINTYGALDNAGFVDRVYRNVLGRAPDAGGLAHWKGQLDGGMTRGRLMVEFSESAEYRGLIANEVYVTMVYAGMLRRAPDASGFSFWVSYLDAGNSGIALVNGFLGGAEYRARFLP